MDVVDGTIVAPGSGESHRSPAPMVTILAELAPSKFGSKRESTADTADSPYEFDDGIPTGAALLLGGPNGGEQRRDDDGTTGTAGRIRGRRQRSETPHRAAEAAAPARKFSATPEYTPMSEYSTGKQRTTAVNGDSYAPVASTTTSSSVGGRSAYDSSSQNRPRATTVSNAKTVTKFVDDLRMNHSKPFEMSDVDQYSERKHRGRQHPEMDSASYPKENNYGSNPRGVGQYEGDPVSMQSDYRYNPEHAQVSRSERGFNSSTTASSAHSSEFLSTSESRQNRVSNVPAPHYEQGSQNLNSSSIAYAQSHNRAPFIPSYTSVEPGLQNGNEDGGVLNLSGHSSLPRQRRARPPRAERSDSQRNQDAVDALFRHNEDNLGLPVYSPFGDPSTAPAYPAAQTSHIQQRSVIASGRSPHRGGVAEQVGRTTAGGTDDLFQSAFSTSQHAQYSCPGPVRPPLIFEPVRDTSGVHPQRDDAQNGGPSRMGRASTPVNDR